jgi:hypothetical protein
MFKRDMPKAAHSQAGSAQRGHEKARRRVSGLGGIGQSRYDRLQCLQQASFLAQQGLVQPAGQDFFWGASGQLPQLLRVSAEATRASVWSAFMMVWC